jgi:predicted glycosyltransferase
MKIWIDFINSPQVSFFDPLIRELQKDGHEFILTCRDSANTLQLVKQRNWDHKVIGTKAEKSLGKKLFSFPMRVFALYRYLKDKNVDIAICQSSFYLPMTAKMLGIPSIYTNDNEHAMGNIPSFLFATQILVPENLRLSKIYSQGAKKNKVIQYPGIKEGVYLWTKGMKIQQKRGESHQEEKQIYVRPEPLTAQYYSGKLNFLDELLIELKEKYPVTVLVRDKTQFKHYAQHKFKGIRLPEDPLPFEDVAVNCLLFVGAGGSMTREMAIMGIPTISVYQGELLDVDKFLIKKKLLIHCPSIEISVIDDLIQSGISQQIDDHLLKKGKKAYELFKFELLKYTK